jgi:hypothetical protein
VSGAAAGGGESDGGSGDRSGGIGGDTRQLLAVIVAGVGLWAAAGVLARLRGYRLSRVVGESLGRALDVVLSKLVVATTVAVAGSSACRRLVSAVATRVRNAGAAVYRAVSTSSTGAVSSWLGRAPSPGSVLGGGGRDATGTGANRIEGAWNWLVSQVSVRDPETRTPGEVARAAIREGHSRYAVEDLLWAYREVEYGDRQPTEEREQAAVQAQKRLREGADTDRSESR